MSHYFTNDEIESKEKQIIVKIKDTKLLFTTDNGVFSKKGLDFGTRTLLESLDLTDIKGKVLDFGCGYGPVGIYLSLKTDAKIDMVDINERALNLAKKNTILNNVNPNIFQSDIYSNIKEKYDFIITNPPIRVGKKILYEILFKAFDHLNENGELWFVVNKNQGAKSIFNDLEKKYYPEIIIKNKGFYIIKTKNKKIK